MIKPIRLVAACLMLVLAGCSGDKPLTSAPTHSASPPPPASGAAEEPTGSREWVPPEKGAVVPWKSLPEEVRKTILRNGDRSPDGRWVAARTPSVSGRLPEVWVAATDETTARLIEQDLPMYGAGVWSPWGTYLYYHNPDDSWREVDPASGKVKPFLPKVLTGQKAGFLRFSPDGRRLLFNTGLCYCNRPPQNPITTFVVNTDGMDLMQVGVNVDARWEGNQVVLSLAGFYPLDVRAGTPEIDRVIEALAQKDVEELVSLIRMRRVACSNRIEGPGGLPCPQGKPDGTLLEVFPSSSCAPNYVFSKEPLRGFFQDLTAQDPAVYAVYRAKQQEGDPAPAYGIIVSGRKGSFVARTLLLDAKGAVIEQFSCGGGPNMLPRDAEFVLQPKSPFPSNQATQAIPAAGATGH